MVGLASHLALLVAIMVVFQEPRVEGGIFPGHLSRKHGLISFCTLFFFLASRISGLLLIPLESPDMLIQVAGGDFFVVVTIFQDRILLNDPGWSGSRFVDQVALKFRDIHLLLLPKYWY